MNQRLDERILELCKKAVDTPASPELEEILEELRVYLKDYETDYWKGSGRLAKLGLPRSLVSQLRRLRALVQNTIAE